MTSHSITKFFTGVPDIRVGVPENGATDFTMPHYRELHGVPDNGAPWKELPHFRELQPQYRELQ